MSDSDTTQIRANADQLQEVWKRLDKLEIAVFTGNGTPSLKERVAAMERAIQTQTWLMRTVLGVVLSNLAALMFLLLRRGL